MTILKWPNKNDTPNIQKNYFVCLFIWHKKRLRIYTRCGAYLNLPTRFDVRRQISFKLEVPSQRFSIQMDRVFVFHELFSSSLFVRKLKSFLEVSYSSASLFFLYEKGGKNLVRSSTLIKDLQYWNMHTR